MNVPKTIPDELLDSFTMGGQLPIENFYRNDSDVEVQEQILNNYLSDEIERTKLRLQKRESNYYGNTDLWLYEALDKYPIKDLSVVIFGSTHPWYELMAKHFGAASVTVVEYSDRNNIEDIEYIKPDEVGERKFDVAISISSFEHDGLGRYGDPIDPIGDIKAMAKCHELLKEKGLLFLAVPVGRDKIVFNVHRVYGEKRLPLLLENWKALIGFGFFEGSFTNEYNGVNGSPYQPLVVLQK